jgi:hypothetical protein
VGPGLLLALVLLAGGRARAETAVGLDARGVDPMAAVNNQDGLDVRDALGRPVSAQVVLDQLKRAEAARAAQNSYSSSLPKANAVLSSLEYSVGGLLTLVRLIDGVPVRVEWASLPAPGPKLSALFLILLGAVLAQAATVLRPRASLPALSSCRRSLEVLRC